jgi:hypothetical protein
MKTARHIVIDIETLGRRNDAAITQIGIVPADENFDVLDHYLIQTEPKTWNTCERTFTGETLLWWIQQKNSPESNKPTHIVHSYKFLVDKLYQIFNRYNTEETIVWTKGQWICFALKTYASILIWKLPGSFGNLETSEPQRSSLKSGRPLRIIIITLSMML